MGIVVSVRFFGEIVGPLEHDSVGKIVSVLSLELNMAADRCLVWLNAEQIIASFPPSHPRMLIPWHNWQPTVSLTEASLLFQ